MKLTCLPEKLNEGLATVGRVVAPRSTLPVYRRQHFPESLAGDGSVPPLKSGTELFKNDEVRVWTLDGEVVIASITAKLHLISPTVTESCTTSALPWRWRMIARSSPIPSRGAITSTTRGRTSSWGNP